jgi:hypothetical protein
MANTHCASKRLHKIHKPADFATVRQGHDVLTRNRLRTKAEQKLQLRSAKSCKSNNRSALID